MEISAGYSYTDAEITKDEVNPHYVGNTPEQVAKHKATLWADFYPTDNLTLKAGLRYQQGMQIDRLNSDELPSVTVMDIGGSWRVNDTWNVDANVSNLFDKAYVGTCFDTSNCWMGPERQVSMSVRARF